MLSKRNLLVVIFVTFVCLFVSFFILFKPHLKTTDNLFHSHSTYDTLKERYPSFESDFNRFTDTNDFLSLASYSEALIAGAEEGYEKTYLTYVTAYSYTNAVILHNEDSESLEKAMRYSKMLIFDIDQYPIFRAHTLDSYDRLLFIFVQPSIREKVMQDQEFKEFLNIADVKDADTYLYRKKLLTRAVELYPVANAYFKLALITAQELNIEPKTSVQKELNEQSKKVFFKHMAHGDEYLQHDYKGEGLFQNMKQVPETLLSRTLAAQIYFVKTKEKPFGDITDLFQKAITESERLNPAYTHILTHWQSLWLANKLKENP